MKSYTIVIHKAEEGGYYAECPALKGCYTQGETLEEIRCNMKEAIELYLEDNNSVVEAIEEIIEVAYA